MGKKADKSGPNWIERQVLRIFINSLIKKLNKMNGSWKTTLMGWLTLVGGIIYAILALVDGDPTTKPDFNAVVEALAALGIAVPAWLGFIFSRDNDKSSEKVGAR